MNITAFNEIVEQNDQTQARSEHLEKLRALVGNVYPNKFERSSVSGDEDTITNLIGFAPVAEVVGEIKAHILTLDTGSRPDPEVKEVLNARLRELGNVRISGRLAVPPRVMGKAAFVHLSDGVRRLQIYVRRDDVRGVYNGVSQPSAADVSVPSAVADGSTVPSSTSEGELQPSATADGTDMSAGGIDVVSGWEVFGLLDHGDFIGVEGFLFLTNTGELSVHVETLQFLAKALVPMPDKMHGIVDPELQRRFRYADLIASSLQIEHDGLTTRQVFERRAKLISGMRRFLDDRGFIEVETPMLTPKATGAAAKPFETHHNALDIPLYARVAPELYLKRLTVGGFEKVYELNRNFRNEGLSHKHNPEFTMLEFYCAYMDVNGMMDFCEEIIKESVQKANGGSLVVNYDGKEIDFSKFERLSMRKAIGTKGTSPLDQGTSPRDQGTSPRDQGRSPRVSKGAHDGDDTPAGQGEGALADARASADDINEQNIVQLFEERVEANLIQPTFIIDYPKSISPLSKASPANPSIAERFELFINGMECANGFSELNDPHEQYQRFVDQMKEREGGDEEAMVMDEDYIRALSYGMPPAAGIGIGIDRLVMLLTNKHSIRDVILFPHMRPEKRDDI